MRKVVRFALQYAIDHTQKDFEKEIFISIADNIDNNNAIVLVEIEVLKQILYYGYIFTNSYSKYDEFVALIQSLESEKETLIHI